MVLPVGLFSREPSQAAPFVDPVKVSPDPSGSANVTSIHEMPTSGTFATEKSSSAVPPASISTSVWMLNVIGSANAMPTDNAIAATNDISMTNAFFTTCSFPIATIVLKRDYT